jgi:hypothetical protein
VDWLATEQYSDYCGDHSSAAWDDLKIRKFPYVKGHERHLTADSAEAAAAEAAGYAPERPFSDREPAQ